MPTQITISDFILLQQQKYKLMLQIEKSNSPAVRAGLFVDLRKVSDLLGAEVPELNAFAYPKAKSNRQAKQ
ncbi:hypothetical protein [Undibacterium umbellatum]|uniref:Uncharacterized protein n=1 Tax=Undibacterium umbellatum TaxID=2762300 RepID=A0ABR6ZIS9_9BURK|nr:hypothetical protein [Undibacterium umbellatum]MBC3911628.1 hypothetical protein [Undibacterium umbellatum]